MVGEKVLICILAGGFGRRMLGYEGSKLLVPLQGRALIAYAFTAASEVKAPSDKLVISGYDAEKIEALASSFGLKCTFNADHQSGMGSALRVAAEVAEKRGASGLLIMLGDMPQITGADLDRLIAVFHEAGHKDIVRAYHGATPGHPVILPRALFHEMTLLAGDRGAKKIIDNSTLREIAIDIGAAALSDVDTPQMLKDFVFER